MASAKEKAELRKKHPKCYVCETLGLDWAELAGYEDAAVQFDHWKPQGLVGDVQADLLANLRPIHADPAAPSPTDPNWEASTRRNCHKGKGNVYDGEEWCEYVRMYRQALKAEYSDDLMPGRNPDDSAYQVDISWAPKSATFGDQTYPVMEQQVGPGSGEKWVSFSTVIPPTLLWRDEDVQSRGASPERLTRFAWHLRSNPLLTPILCRLADGRLKVFDGNHRLTAFILARKDHPVPSRYFKARTRSASWKLP